MAQFYLYHFMFIKKKKKTIKFIFKFIILCYQIVEKVNYNIQNGLKTDKNCEMKSLNHTSLMKYYISII